ASLFRTVSVSTSRKPSPYTTLFRSRRPRRVRRPLLGPRFGQLWTPGWISRRPHRIPRRPACSCATEPSRHHHHVVPAGGGECGRSEEHTSELQSRENLVCRLLLEKK